MNPFIIGAAAVLALIGFMGDGEKVGEKEIAPKDKKENTSKSVNEKEKDKDEKPPKSEKAKSTVSKAVEKTDNSDNKGDSGTILDESKNNAKIDGETTNTVD